MQVIAVVGSVAALIVTVGLMRRLLRSNRAAARLQQALKAFAEWENALQERRKQEWWARNTSPALALARADQHRPYRLANR